MTADRRLQKRKQLERMVFHKLGGEESGSVLNLSEDGLCFESVTPIQEKDLLQLRLSVDPNNAIEATGRLAWIDSAKRTGGLRFVELSAPAREQISAWLTEISTASSESNSAVTEKSLTSQDISVPSTQLVPIERYRAQTRWQFLRGVLVGFGICAVLMIPILLYVGRTKPGSPDRTTAGTTRPAQSSAEQTQASPQPASPRAFISQPAAAKPLATKPAVVQAPLVAPPARSAQQTPQTAGQFSTDLMTRTSSPSASPRPPRAQQPLEARQTAVAPAPAASNVLSSSGQVQHPKKAPPTPQQLWSAVEAGNINAAVALADLYARGEGVPVNCQQARVLLLVASEKKNAEASKKLQELDKGGCPAKAPIKANEPKP